MEFLSSEPRLDTMYRVVTSTGYDVSTLGSQLDTKYRVVALRARTLYGVSSCDPQVDTLYQVLTDLGLNSIRCIELSVPLGSITRHIVSSCDPQVNIVY